MEPATKQDLLHDRQDRVVQDVRTDLLQRMDEHAVHLKKCIRDWRTEILKAFLNCQEAESIRISNLESSNHSVIQRMDILEHRLFEIEKKLLLKPPAA